jgi:hypothetical protein
LSSQFPLTISSSCNYNSYNEEVPVLIINPDCPVGENIQAQAVLELTVRRAQNAMDATLANISMKEVIYDIPKPSE